MKEFENDRHFKLFAVTLENTLESLGKPEQKGMADEQRKDIESMIELENKIRQNLIEHRWGRVIYKRFIKYIKEDKQNVLAARPFFRERQKVFTDQISDCIKNKDDKGLTKFNFNFQFISFILKSKPWKPNCKLKLFALKHEQIRNRIVQMNLPLAISRARIFYSRTPPSHLQYMDFVQIGCEGLMAAVDKFCIPFPFKSVFPAVVIGRITGNFIEQYSETSVHFYPKDKRKLYRANKIIGQNGGQAVDFEELAQKVNEFVDSNHNTNSTEIADLMAAASTVSSDITIEKEDGNAQTLISKCAAPGSYRPDVTVETAEAYKVMQKAIDTPESNEGPTLKEQKLLKLKYGDM